MKKKSIQFRDENQKKLFDFLLLVAQNTPQDVYKKYEGEAKAVITLPSIRAEYAKVETFDTQFKSSVEQFLVKVEFWLKTVYLKLEPEKVDMLLKLAKSMRKHNAENPETPRAPFEFLLTSMNVEPDARKYVINVVKEKREKILKDVTFDFFDEAEDANE